MAIKEVNLGLPTPPIENSGVPRNGATPERPFRNTLEKALGDPPPSSPEARQQVEMYQNMARMELMNLNGLLLGALGGASPGNLLDMGGLGGSGVMTMLQMWRRIGLLGEPASQNDVGPAGPTSEKQQPKVPERPAEPEGNEPELPAVSGDPPEDPEERDSWLSDLVEKTARAFGVDSSLVKAVVQTESGFNHQAVSPAGAMGLMQLMPGTARDLGVEDPFDPVQNVAGGVRYLKMMLDKYAGDVDDALAAYNWGPGNLDRNRGTGRMPLETQNYIRIVNSLYRKYRKDEDV